MLFTRKFADGTNPIVDPSAVYVVFAWNTYDSFQEHTCKSTGAVWLILEAECLSLLSLFLIS